MNRFTLRLPAVAALVLGLLLAVSGCAPTGDGAERTARDAEEGIVVENIRVRDYQNLGPNMLRFRKPPQRLVVSGPGEIETVLALGCGDRIVLAESYYDLPAYVKPEYVAAAEKIPFTSTGYLSLESVLLARPDLLIAQQSTFTAKHFGSTDFWNSRGIATFVPWNTNRPDQHAHVETIENEVRFLRGLGQILAVEDRAEHLISEIYEVIAAVTAYRQGKPSPRVLVVEDFGKYIVSYDRTRLTGDMVARLGGTIPETAAVLGWEGLMEIDPDVIFVVDSYQDPEQARRGITRHPFARNLQAVAAGRVYVVPLECVYSSEVRTADGLRLLADGMYPGWREEHTAKEEF